MGMAYTYGLYSYFLYSYGLYLVAPGTGPSPLEELALASLV